MAVTARWFEGRQNRFHEARMPILMLALIALGAFGFIGLLLVLAVSLEHRKLERHEPPNRSAA
jgi:hypothetical protein